jgi:hypothetical protein
VPGAVTDESRRSHRARFPLDFRDWAADRTNFLNEVAEAALAHVVGNKVEAAYRRGVEKRKRLMNAWSEFRTKSVPAADKVIPLARSTK